MRDKVAPTKNLKRFIAAIRSLEERPLGIEGMGLLWGYPGEGKTTSIAYVVNLMNGIHIRALDSWTPSSMLEALLFEMGLPARKRKADMVNMAIRKLMESPRPIFVDEADYLIKPGMLDSWRDIYDLTGVSVILVGMEDLARNIQSKDNGKFARRITEWIEFDGIDKDDARILADTVCEVKVADDLLASLYKEAKANIGYMMPALARIESMGKTNGLEVVTGEDWGTRSLVAAPPKIRRRKGFRD